MIKKILFISCLAIFSGMNAQKTHTVAKGDNPYNIAKKYGMTLEELTKLNPKAKDGKLNIGDVLVVNGKKSVTTTPKPAVTEKPKSSAVGKIILQPKQTLYGITKQYHVTEAQIKALNPNLAMQIGEEIVLPLENIKKYADAKAVAPVPEPVKEVAPVATEAKTIDADSYEIQPKDNYYRITKKFGVTQSQLFSWNPGLEAKGLKPGDVIKVKGNAVTSSAPASTTVTEQPKQNTYTNTTVADDYVTYTVQDGDTVFGILNKFGVTLDQLLELNPQLSNGLKAGMVLKIKKGEQGYVKNNSNALGIALMLPFGFDANDSKYRSMALDFLTGAKLAIERNARAGQLLDVKVIDAGSESSFKNSLSKINGNNTDLIIGPFLKSNVVEVLKYVNAKKIPVVAPFANSEDLYNYSNLIIVETNDNVYAERISKEVAQVYSDQKIYIVSDDDKTNANYIKNSLEKSLKNPNIIIVNSPLDIQPDKNMMTGQAAPVIAILANSNDEAGSAFSNRMIALSKEVSGVKAFSMYYHPSFEKKVDELSQTSLVYLMDRKINAEGSFEKEILADYKEKYCKSPSKYAIIGFDVVNDILTRENKKGEVFKQINKVQTQLATKFEYVRAKNNGAYINTGYRVVRLVP